jgi:Ca2+-transporting ATPase
MANATVICTDKTGTLTQNKMSVVAGSIGIHLKFADRLAENAARTNANDDRDPEKIVDEGKTSAAPATRQGRLDFSTEMSEINKHVSPALRKLLNDSVAINSTAFEGTDEHGAEGGFVGSKTETALLSFAQGQGWPHYKVARGGAKVVQMIPFSSERKAMGVVVQLPNGTYRLMLKGASEVLAKLCNRHVVVEENVDPSIGTESDDIATAEFTDETRANICKSTRSSACVGRFTDSRLSPRQPAPSSSTPANPFERSPCARATSPAGHLRKPRLTPRPAKPTTTRSLVT